MTSDARPPGAATGKAEQKQRTHTSILASAARLLRERGISGASVADVMKGAGLTVGGFYAHFASKEAMIDAALRRTALAMRDRLFTRLDDKPAADRAEIILKRYLSAAHRDDVHDGCSLPSVVGEVSTTAGEHRGALRDQLDAFASELEGHLHQPPTVSRRQLALGLIALMYGGLALARAVRGTDLSDELLRACRALGRHSTRISPE